MMNPVMPLSAAQIENKYGQKNNWNPHYFINPMQDLDYIVIEAILKNTFVGALMNAFTKFIVGTGFKPELELINPDKENDENNINEINNNQEIINDLMEIDRQLDTNLSGQQDISFVEKISALIDTTNSFNRSALIFSYDKPVKIRGKTYKQIPSGLKFAHARDLGIIEVTPDSWKLEAVQWRQAYYMVPSTDMMYLWNPLISAKYHNAWFYGGSMVLPMLDAARVIRKIIGVDFPAMAEATWAGMFILAVKPQGQTADQKRAEYKGVASNLVRGGPNILMEDPENLSFNSIDFSPKITEFKDLTDFLIRYCVATLGLPQTMFFDETTSTRATMIGKIQLAISTVINPIREQFGRQISSQWYQRWFELLYKDRPELLKIFRIKMGWNDLHIETWFDKIESVNEVDARHQLTHEAYGEMSGIENYVNKIDKDAETTPGGSGGNKINMSDGEGGSLEIKKKGKNFNAVLSGMQTKKKGEDGTWVVSKGQHIFIPDGEDKVDKTTNAALSGIAKVLNATSIGGRKVVKWITVNGAAVPVFEGMSEEEAGKEFLRRKDMTPKQQREDNSRIKKEQDDKFTERMKQYKLKRESENKETQEKTQEKTQEMAQKKAWKKAHPYHPSNAKLPSIGTDNDFESSAKKINDKNKMPETIQNIKPGQIKNIKKKKLEPGDSDYVDWKYTLTDSDGNTVNVKGNSNILHDTSKPDEMIKSMKEMDKKNELNGVNYQKYEVTAHDLRRKEVKKWEKKAYGMYKDWFTTKGGDTEKRESVQKMVDEKIPKEVIEFIEKKYLRTRTDEGGFSDEMQVKQKILPYEEEK